MTDTLTHLEELLAKTTDDNAAALDHARAWNELRLLAPHALPALIARVRELEGIITSARERLDQFSTDGGSRKFERDMRDILTKQEPDPVEQAITSWLYESGYEGNAGVEQALRKFLELAPEAATTIERAGGVKAVFGEGL